MSEFVYLFRTSEAQQSEAMGTPERAKKSMQVWLSWVRELEANGHLRDPGQPLALEGKVVRGANQVISDGPYAEAKDLVLGFMIVEARDLSHAAELARGCPIATGGGSVEIRPVGMSPSPNRGEAA
ncbi:MAG TPA: YciI family protein [Polyangiaceae bacterium]|nr:YciI family protein [Polyangiaceae bacterium]